MDLFLYLTCEDVVAVFFMNDAMNKNTVQSRNSTPHIMVVDDAEDILLMIKIGLEEENFSVDTFRNAKSVVSERNAPDYYKLVLTDIRMPNMNGFALYLYLFLSSQPSLFV